jgi:glyoxylase-like metal-dependent hydrolase (beta-lactamase superfamily II)
MEVYVVSIAIAAANPPDLEALLKPVLPLAAPAPAPPPFVSERLADGVYRLTNGGYDALAVGLKDFSVILGGGGSAARGVALVAETKRLFPGRPIRDAVNMHGHFDHAMVLPVFASEGITILTDDQNQYFLEESLVIPRTLLGDALAKSKKKPKVEGVMEKLVLGDEARRIELYHLKQIPHADGMLAAWLPTEKILFVSDIELPEAGQPPSPSLLALLQNIDRLAIDFDTLITNGRESVAPMSKTELFARIQKAK